LVISNGIVEPLVDLALREKSQLSLLQHLAWTFSNVCRRKENRPYPPPVQQQDAIARQCLPALAKLLSHSDPEIITDACWGISYLTESGSDKIIEAVVKADDVIPRLVHLLGSPVRNVITPSLRTVGNIVTGSDLHTQAIVDAGALVPLIKLLQAPYERCIVKEAAWTVSNICAGTTGQIHAVIKCGIVPLLLNILRNDDYFPGQKEATNAIANITSEGTTEQMDYLCKNGVIPPMCEMLNCRDWRTIITALDALENLLKAQKVGQQNKVASAIEECGGLDKIEHLQSTDNNTIYAKAYSLIDAYFAEEEEGSS